MHWADYGWGIGFGWLFMVIFWVLVILGVIFIIKTIAGTGKAENVFKEVSITLKDGEAAALEFKPVYRTARHPMQNFAKGIVFFEVFMNGTPISK